MAQRQLLDGAELEMACGERVVSHDRYFLDKVVTRVVEVRDRQLVSYSGNFTDFWFARKELTPRADGRASKRRTRRDGPKRGAETDSTAALERRAADAFERRDQRRGRHAAKKLQRLKAQLDGLYENWLTAYSS